MTTQCEGRREDLSRLVNAACVPIFIGNYFAIDGRGPLNLSATGTLVRFEDRLFVVTCEHVRKKAYAAEGDTASVAVGRAIINLSSWVPDSSMTKAELVPALRQLKTGGSDPDVSIAELPMHYLDLISRQKEKTL